jgi:signal peptidase II
LKKYLWDYAQLVTIAGVVVLLDQLTKAWVRLNVPIGTVYKPDWWLSQYVRIVYLKNRGAGLGIFKDMSVVSVLIGIAVSLAIILYFPRISRNNWRLRLALALLLAGALGNPIDRLLFHGYVTDFISLGNLPVLNLADASVSIGAVILALGMWFQNR